MLEMQEDKSIKKLDPQSQKINAGWQKYNKRLINLHDDAQIKTVRKDIDNDHEYTTKHSKEGSGTVMKEKNSADDQTHRSYEKHEKASEHKEEGSGMR